MISPEDQLPEDGIVVYCMSYKHPATGQRIVSKDGKPFRFVVRPKKR